MSWRSPRFETPEAITAWRDQPDHVATRERGRGEFFESYEITIATVNRHYDWQRSRGSRYGEVVVEGVPGVVPNTTQLLHEL